MEISDRLKSGYNEATPVKKFQSILDFNLSMVFKIILQTPNLLPLRIIESQNFPPPPRR